MSAARGPATQHELVIVANRLPVQCVDGEWRTSPGGLVRAMLSVARGRRGAWVGWPGDTATSTTPHSVEEAIPHLPHDGACSDLTDPDVRAVEDVDLVPVA